MESPRYLLPHHQKRLTERGITDEVRDARGWYSTEDPQHLRALGFKEYQARAPALVILSHSLYGGDPEPFIRPDVPRVRGSGADAKPVKYDRLVGSQNFLDVNPIVRQQVMDPAIPLHITEGAFKVDTLISHGHVAVGLQGVWGFCTEDGGSKGIIPELREIPFGKRLTYIAFDSDIQTKEGVYRAAIELGKALRSRGAIVKYVIVPSATRA